MGSHQSRELTEQQRIKLDSGKPVLLPCGVKIIKNPRTGKLEGVPEQWVNSKIQLPYEIDPKKMQKTKDLPEEIRPEQQLPESIIRLINSQHSEIEMVKGAKPKPNLDIDPNNQYGIKNLPNEWVEKLTSSKISAEDVRSDPKGTIQMITSYQEQLRESDIESDIMTTNQFEQLVKQVKFIEQNPASCFIFDKQLGKGAMCKVYYAYDREAHKRKDYAVRIIKLRDQKTLGRIKVEIAVMKLCHERNLVNYFFSYYFKESLFMFVQFMNAGALTDFVYHFMNRIPEQIISYITREILLGLQAIHGQRQLHRDLKSDNILLSRKGEVKIADFGFAMQLTKERLNRKSVVGTPAWMPPQLIKKQDYNEKVDIWSLGMVVFELCNGEPPYLRLPHLKAMHNIVSKAPPRIKGFSFYLCDFVERCLQKNPEDRWTAEELLNHKFIKEIGDGHAARKQLVSCLDKMNRKGPMELQDD